MSWAQIGERVGSRNLAVLAQTYTHVLMDDREVDYEALLRTMSVVDARARAYQA